MNTTTESTPLPTPNIVKIKSGIKVDLNATTHAGTLCKKPVFHDAKTGFAIFELAGVMCKGRLHSIELGAYYALSEGQFEQDLKYNTWNFVFKKADSRIVAGNGLREYLGREAPGVGPRTAAEIVRVFGDDAINTLATDFNRIQDIPGLDYDARLALHQWAKANLADATIKERLYGIGLTPSLVGRLIRHFGGNAESKIRADCFQLTKIHGIGFRTAASIADLLGIPAGDPGRLAAACVYAMEQLCDGTGHTCIARRELLREVTSLTKVAQDKINPCLDRLLADSVLVSSSLPFAEYCQKTGTVQ